MLLDCAELLSPSCMHMLNKSPEVRKGVADEREAFLRELIPFADLRNPEGGSEETLRETTGGVSVADDITTVGFCA